MKLLNTVEGQFVVIFVIISELSIKKLFVTHILLELSCFYNLYSKFINKWKVAICLKCTFEELQSIIITLELNIKLEYNTSFSFFAPVSLNKIRNNIKF